MRLKRADIEDLEKGLLYLINSFHGLDLNLEASAFLLSRITGHLYVLEKDDEVIGMATLCVQQRLDAKVATIEEVVIHEDFRGYGYGKLLISLVLGEAKLYNDIDRVSLYCNNNNVEFYRKCGFRHTSNGMRIDLK